MNKTKKMKVCHFIWHAGMKSAFLARHATFMPDIENMWHGHRIGLLIPPIKIAGTALMPDMPDVFKHLWFYLRSFCGCTFTEVQCLGGDIQGLRAIYPPPFLTLQPIAITTRSAREPVEPGR